MKKIVALLSLSTFVFVGCNAGANAQTNGVSVGNPDSDNTLVVEQGYIISGPANPTLNNNVPAPAAVQPVNNTQPAQMQPANNDGAAVLENIYGSETPSSQSIEVDEMVIPNN